MWSSSIRQSNTNGNTLDLAGRLLHAEHSGRISRTDANGTVVTVVDSFEGAKLSSPNDVDAGST